MDDILKKVRVGIAVCGSFCTFDKAFAEIENLKERCGEVIPIMSHNAAYINTRFGDADYQRERLKKICDREIITTIEGAEPIGPQNMTDVMLVMPCTGNTLAKLSSSVTDSPVTMAVKSHLRNNRPVVIAVATNDALAGTFKNIGQLMNYKNYYFLPLRQDDFIKKPSSVVSDFSLAASAIEAALEGRQLQPLL